MRSLYPRIFVALFLFVQFLLARDVLAADLPGRFASVYKVSGVVVLIDAANGSRRELKPGDIVRVGDRVQASATGEAVLRTDDAGVIAVRPNASFVMERFSARGSADDNFGMRIFAGALRLISGWTGLRNRENYRVQTPTATIGIRGTDHEPYVLSPELAARFQQAEGTYNKVNRGATTLDAAGQQLAIDAGQVGYAPAKPAGNRTRGLMTALLPGLLAKVPGFYVPGVFDAELEDLAARDLAEALKVLAPEGSSLSLAARPLADKPEPTPELAQAAPKKPGKSSQCAPADIAKTWLDQLDASIQARNALAFVNLFAPQVKVIAKVHNSAGDFTEVRYSRSELAQSTFASFDQLSQFSSRRPSVTALLVAASARKCDRIEVESVVIESGVRAGLSYRLESLETYTLARQSGVWLAVKASTTQR